MKTYHLVSGAIGWQLKIEGNATPLQYYMLDTKPEAIAKAKVYIMINGGGSLRIHLQDGTFEEERTYPRAIDPRQSPG